MTAVSSFIQQAWTDSPEIVLLWAWAVTVWLSAWLHNLYRTRDETDDRHD